MSGPAKISLCMIVRNEEENLPRCLKSVQEAVDEIIVVDTGSTDRTMAIAKSFGAKVVEQEWRDDFSAARNCSLEEASGDWILWLDADEELAPGSAETLRIAASRKEFAGFHLAFTNELDGGRQMNLLFLRLFRRDDTIRWKNIVHEQILEAVENYAAAHKLKIGSCEARIIHHGYLSEEFESKGKAERNRRLLLKQLEHYPADPYSWHQYGDFIRREDPAEGIRALRRAVDLLAELPESERKACHYASDTCALLARELQKKNAMEEASTALERIASGGFPLSPNYYFGRASVARARGAWWEALKDFEQCTALAGKNFLVPVPPEVTGPLAWNGMAQCLEQLGKIEEAAGAYEKALAGAPEFTPIVLAATRFFLKHGLGDAPTPATRQERP